ncbi:MAG: MBL fold metallo-hydrolase [Proteobacteria bacterium]|nr:MBL fold metallo-hydrolase [Pseudomonadota bacterium]
MGLIIKRKILEGVYWVEVPEADLRILCGCPADSIKHVAERGFLPMVEKNGVEIESGPNAILLSDVLVQNGELSNLSEFPIYHMFYNQGMILPDHPNYSGLKPLIIGNESQVQAQMEYVFRGYYGLVTEDEFLSVGESIDFAKENLRMKLRFSPGSFILSQELIDGVILKDKPAELRSGVTIERLQENVFNIAYKNKAVKVNLNLRKYRKYKPPYILPKVDIPNHHFAIVHTGEGNGWDHLRPCMSSVILFDGKFFVLDTGPNILQTLKAFGIKPWQLEGVFFTHVHDDHFAGLYSLMNEKRKVKLYCTSVVGSTVKKKLSALLSVSEKELERHIEVQELIRDQWNNQAGLEIKPIPSAHPVDTTLFIFRAKGKKGYRTFGYYSDITALSWLRKMVVNNNEEAGISEEYFQSVKKTFSLKMDLKKIDAGGPAIHGDAEDFRNDKSSRLILGHSHKPFTKRQLEIGVQVSFGEVDVLIEEKP